MVLDAFEYFIALVIFDSYSTGNDLASVPSQDQLLTSSSALSNLPLKTVMLSPTKPLKPSTPVLHNIYYEKISPNVYPPPSLM